MEYVLQDTDIFEERIGTKLHNVIKKNRDNFCNGKAYKLTVSFHINLLDDQRFDEFNIIAPSKTSKGTKKDKIYDVMSIQLGKLEEILSKNLIEINSSTIEGDYIESESIIKIQINEDTSEPVYSGKGKNKVRMKSRVISPAMPRVRETAAKFAAESLGNIYCEFMGIIKDKKMMSQILEIDPTEQDKLLIKAFVEKYGELWLATGEKREMLLNRLKERALFVANKYFGEEEKAE